MSGVTEPIGILQTLHHNSPRTEHFFQPGSRIRNEVPAVVLGHFDGDHFGSALFHLEGKKTAGGTNFQDALSGERDLSQVLIHSTTQIPIAIHHSVTGEFHCVVKVAIGDVFYLQRNGEEIIVAHR